MKTILLSCLFFISLLMDESKANSVVYVQPPVVVYQQPVVQTVMVYQTQYYTVTVPVIQQYQIQQSLWYQYQPIAVHVQPYYIPAQPRKCRLFNY